MMNIRYRTSTNAWPGFVDLFSNLVIILIFLMIVFVFLWTTTSVFNKSTGAKAVAELKQTNAAQAEQIEQMTMDEEEAILQMELLGHNFFVFRNAETDEVNVVYKRKGNTYGLIEPEY